MREVSFNETLVTFGLRRQLRHLEGDGSNLLVFVFEEHLGFSVPQFYSRVVTRESRDQGVASMSCHGASLRAGAEINIFAYLGEFSGCSGSQNGGQPLHYSSDW